MTASRSSWSAGWLGLDVGDDAAQGGDVALVRGSAGVGEAGPSAGSGSPPGPVCSRMQEQTDAVSPRPRPLVATGHSRA